MNKIKILIYILLILCTITVPIIMYSSYIPGEISHKNQDWAAFGSFVGGLYSAVFSFASVAILVYSLYLTQKNNREQLTLQQSEQTTSEFNMLLDILENQIKNKQIFSKNNSYNVFSLDKFYFKMAEYSCENGDITQQHFDKSVRIIASEYLKQRENGNYDDEISILKAIMYRIYNANSSLLDAYKVVFNNKISSDARFFIRLYCLNTDPILEKYFTVWPDFVEIPEKFAGYINDQLVKNEK